MRIQFRSNYLESRDEFPPVLLIWDPHFRERLNYQEKAFIAQRVGTEKVNYLNEYSGIFPTRFCAFS
jgi:hypothetical protein